MIKDLIGYEGTLVFNTKYQDGASTKILADRLFRQKFPDFEFTDIQIGIKETINYYKAKLEL